MYLVFDGAAEKSVRWRQRLGGPAAHSEGFGAAAVPAAPPRRPPRDPPRRGLRARPPPALGHRVLLQFLESASVRAAPNSPGRAKPGRPSPPAAGTEGHTPGLRARQSGGEGLARGVRRGRGPPPPRPSPHAAWGRSASIPHSPLRWSHAVNTPSLPCDFALGQCVLERPLQS